MLIRLKIVFASCFVMCFSYANSCSKYLRSAEKFREEARSDSAAEKHLWVRSIEDVDFSRAMSALERLEALFQSDEGSESTFLIATLANPTLLKSFTQLSGVDLKPYMKRLDGTAELLMNGILFKFFYSDAEKIPEGSSPLQYFKTQVDEVEEFASRIEYLKKCYVENKRQLNDEVKLRAKQYFHFYNLHGFFNRQEFALALRPRSFKEMLTHGFYDVARAGPVKNSELLTKTHMQKVFKELENYRDWQKPFFVRGQSGEVVWYWIQQKQRIRAFKKYEAEVWKMLDSLLAQTGDERAQNAYYFFRSLDMFWHQFSSFVDDSTRASFFNNIVHNFENILSAVSEGDGFVVDGDRVSHSTFKIISRWTRLVSEKINLGQDVSYRMGTASRGDLDP